MFVKPFRIKSSTAIRGSDRRKLKQRAKELFSTLSQDDVDKILPNKEEMNVVKILTHAEVNITCYTVRKNPVFVDYDGNLFPTVYTLWQFPDMIPSLHTWAPVFQKLRGGADLMLPGIVPPESGLPEYGKGSVVSVSLVGNRAPIAVGTATVSSLEALESGMRGKGVQILHHFMDQLWQIGDQTQPPVLDQGCTSTEDHNNVLGADLLGEGLLDSAERLPLEEAALLEKESSPGEGVGAVAESIGEVGIHDANEMQETADEENVPGDSAESPDDMLTHSFLQALLDAKKTSLPLLVSTFSGDYLKHACLDGKPIDVKKSSYKKLSKFLQHMQKEGVIQVKQLAKGVDSITAISYGHEAFAEYRRSSFAVRLKEERLKRSTVEQNEDPQGPLVEELYAVSAQTVPLFGANRKGEAMTASDVRGHVTAYVKAEELSDPSNKRLVKLNPILSDILKSAADGQTSLPWDRLISLILNKMNPCFRISIPGRETVFRKGKLEPIEVKVEQRMGNKKVTLIKNLELFGIDTKDFAQKLQQAAASSTSVSQLPGKNSPGNQVLVQGVQTKHISAIIATYNIPKKYVTGLDKVRPEKKGK